jgi:hypothetical protein
MPQRSVIERIEILEKNVEPLQALPDRVAGVELQILQLRQEIRVEFSATREDLRAEIRAGDGENRRELRDSVQQMLTVIHETNQDTRRYIQVIYEDLVSRLATISEGQRPRKKK